MTKNTFNQAKQDISTSKAQKLFLDDVNIDMKDINKIKNVHHPTENKEAANKKYCDINLLYSTNKREILSKSITEQRKDKFDKITTKTLALKTQVNNDPMHIKLMGLLNQRTKLPIRLTYVIKMLVTLSLNIFN